MSLDTPDHIQAVLSHPQLSFACQGEGMRTGSTRAQQEQARAGAPVLVCPLAEQLTLLVVATAVPAPFWVMLLSLKAGSRMVLQGPKQRAAQQEQGKRR